MSNPNRGVALPRLIPAFQFDSSAVSMQVVQYIVDHLHVDLSVSALAARFSLGEGALLSAFQSHIGIALDQFVLRRRIERALDLLKHTSATDSEIAMGVGWGTAIAFRTAFFQYLGLSPTEYRKILPSKQQAASLARRKRPCKPAHMPEESRGRALPAFALR